MKAFAVLVFLALSALVGFNSMQIQELRQEVKELRQNMRHNEESAKLSDALMAAAFEKLMAARTAIAGVDTAQAKSALEAAGSAISEASKSAGARVGPALAWMQSEAASLGKDIQKRLGGQ